jgi:hypothetical protein
LASSAVAQTRFHSTYHKPAGTYVAWLPPKTTFGISQPPCDAAPPYSPSERASVD